MVRKCCSNCFSDKALKLKINSIGRISRCHYCGTNDASTINIDQLYMLISPLIEVIDSIFEKDTDGYSLFNILSSEFKLFTSTSSRLDLESSVICLHFEADYNQNHESTFHGSRAQYTY